MENFPLKFFDEDYYITFSGYTFSVTNKTETLSLIVADWHWRLSNENAHSNSRNVPMYEKDAIHAYEQLELADIKENFKKL